MLFEHITLLIHADTNARVGAGRLMRRLALAQGSESRGGRS